MSNTSNLYSNIIKETDVTMNTEYPKRKGKPRSNCDNICRRHGIIVNNRKPQSISRNSILFLIEPLRSVESLSAFCA
uniref:Uncharacterized protein n=1 Tax=Solanum tuberosum TaxID=4113 RepID=M1C3H8_SOLTU